MACLQGGVLAAVAAITFPYYPRALSIFGSVATFVGTGLIGGVVRTIAALELGTRGVWYRF